MFFESGRVQKIDGDSTFTLIIHREVFLVSEHRAVNTFLDAAGIDLNDIIYANST